VGALIATVDEPPPGGALANVTGPALAASGLTSMTTLAADGETNAGRRWELWARLGQCMTKLTGARDAFPGCRAAGTARPPPAQPAAANASTIAAKHRVLT
jgi:hypothetical protein